MIKRSTEGVDVTNEANKPVQNLGLPRSSVYFIQMEFALHSKAASRAIMISVTSLVLTITQKINEKVNEGLNISSLLCLNALQRKRASLPSLNNPFESCTVSLSNFSCSCGV